MHPFIANLHNILMYFDIQLATYFSVFHFIYLHSVCLGEYFCEATNRINTIDYVVRSSNIVLDIYGTPAFLTQTPYATEGRRGSPSYVSMLFCSDPPPTKVYWQFGSIRLDVK